MSAKVLNHRKNVRALDEMRAPVHSFDRWTMDQLSAITDKDGEDVRCRVCRRSIRRDIHDGGPTAVTGWRFAGGRWIHKCEGGFDE